MRAAVRASTTFVAVMPLVSRSKEPFSSASFGLCSAAMASPTPPRIREGQMLVYRDPHLIQGTFREHSGNIQGTFRADSGNIQGTFRADSGNIQG